jgi:HlyD family secretion protein
VSTLVRIVSIGTIVAAALYFALLKPGDNGYRYVTLAVARADLETRVKATGTLNAVVTVQVGSQLSGQISELHVDFNDEVKSGQELAALDRSSFEARVREVEAELRVAQAQVKGRQAALKRASAERDFARARRRVLDATINGFRAEADEAAAKLARARALLLRNVGATEEVEGAVAVHEAAEAKVLAAEAEREMQEPAVQAAEAEVLVAEADLADARAAVTRAEAILEQVRVDLSRTIIRSPIDGVVIDRNVDRGQTVAASLEAPTLFTIANDLRRMQLHARVDEADVGRVGVGQAAEFSVDAYPGQTFRGQVTQVRKAPARVENVVTYTVLINAENKLLQLLPGMTAIVDIVVEEQPGALSVANAALHFAPPEPQDRAGTVEAAARDRAPGADLWVLGPDGRPVAVRVELGISDAWRTEIVAGPLAEGDAVIVDAVPAEDGSMFDGLFN